MLSYRLRKFMGWISERKMRTGHSLNHGCIKSARMNAPLRKIVGFVAAGDSSLFGKGDLMELECGHEVYTKATFKARCIYCKQKVID